MSKVDDGLRPLFRKYIKKMHWCTVETGQVTLGVPDSNYCGEGVEGWIEMKATRGWSVKFKPEQIGWHLTRARHGGRTFVAVRRHCATADELYLYLGSDAERLAASGMVQPGGPPPLLAYGGGPAKWDWPLVRRAQLART